jgi:hypothetical protein
MNLDRPLSYEITVRLLCAIAGFLVGIGFTMAARGL